MTAPTAGQVAQALRRSQAAQGYVNDQFGGTITDHTNRLDGHADLLARQQARLDRLHQGQVNQEDVNDAFEGRLDDLDDWRTTINSLLLQRIGPSLVLFAIGFFLAVVAIHLGSSWVVHTVAKATNQKVAPTLTLWLYLIGGIFGGLGAMGLRSFHRVPRQEPQTRVVYAPPGAIDAASRPAVSPPAQQAALPPATPATQPTPRRSFAGAVREGYRQSRETARNR